MHGDWASVDDDGYWFLHGRSDDTLNIAGKRIGPAELESAVVAHPSVAEAAAVGVPHEVKGEVGVGLLGALVPGVEPSDELAGELRALVGEQLGKAFAPERCSSSRRFPRPAVRRSSGGPCAPRRSAPIPAIFRRWKTRRHWRRSSVPQPSDRLDGQIALVTGGGRGIGASIARELAAAGARVAVAARTRAQVDEIAREIGGLALEVDVTDRAAVERMVAEVERELGPIDLLAANAGVAGGSGPAPGERPGRAVAACSR